ncbi:MAG: SDR family NAD(P)-dependent oxidoreductase [Alphaproteobacteria bacterium]
MPMPVPHPLSILITGASSGIGEALALHYANVGVALTLTGRDEARLTRVADACRQRDANVLAVTIDATDRQAMKELIEQADARSPLELVIANAGIGAGSGKRPEGEPIELSSKVFDVNVNGVLNTVTPAAELMAARKRGQIGILSSLASFRGMPGAASYSGSKAAVRVYGESLRQSLAQVDVGVSVICPGFIRSRITDQNRFKMPFFMEADKAANIMARGLAANKARIAFPWQMYWLTRFIAAVPQEMGDWILSRGPSKD